MGVKNKYISIGAAGVLIVVALILGASFLALDGSHRKPILRYTTSNSVEVTVYLVYSKMQNPLYYWTRLRSPVCMEDLCNPIDIEIEWDLLGDFKTYKEFPDDPLTKFDHEPFSTEDHERLKAILADKESLLQDYGIEDLVDTTELIYSDEIDGMTGATSKTFENDIVPGAIYTCYVLWHFVNGDLHTQLLDYTKSMLDDDLLTDMIQSGEKNYLDYILESGMKNISPKVNTAIGGLIWNSDPLISVKAISVVSDEYWLKDSIGSLFVEKFFHMANPVQNALLRHFQSNEVAKDYLSVFLHLLPDMKVNQRNQVYEIFKFNADKLDTEMRKELVSTFKTPRYSMAAKEYELLSKLGLDY